MNTKVIAQKHCPKRHLLVESTRCETTECYTKIAVIILNISHLNIQSFVYKPGLQDYYVWNAFRQYFMK